jgi:hypothetical protein
MIDRLLLVASTIIQLLLISFATSGQSPVDKRASPADSVTGKIGKTEIKITYGSPSVKGRKIWGGLVPYERVWRAGANEATTFYTSSPIEIQGKTLAAGTYSFFIIPHENKDWEVIFNKTARQWGAYQYDEKQDELRVSAVPVKGVPQERLVYEISPDGIQMKWENLILHLKIKE